MKRTPKTFSINPELERAVQLLLAEKKGARGNSPKNFSDVVEAGLRLWMNRSRTSAKRVLAEAKGGAK